MRATLAMDLTCLFLGPSNLTPRGIDRVALAYAWHFIRNWPGDCFAIVPTPWGMRYFDRTRAARGLAALETIWREDIRPEHDPIFAQVKSFVLTGQNLDVPARASKSAPRQMRDFLRLLGATGVALGKPVRSLPEHSIYLNVGQLLFFRPLLSWLAKRQDMLRVFMIHDFIPLEYPAHHVPLDVKNHRAIVDHAAEFADALIVPSQFVRDSLQQSFLPARLAEIEAHVELLPVSPAFLQPAEADSELSGADYFLACGAIDAHKNHILLLEVWNDLIASHGERAPKLVIAGFGSTTSQPVFDFIAQHPALRNKVMIASGLSTPALRKLMMSAKALLMPSITEGFGLPVVEALAQGTAIVASDIPALREAGEGGDVTFLSPDDGAAWKTTILGCAVRTPAAHQTAYVPKQWDEYFAGIQRFLTGLARESVIK